MIKALMVCLAGLLMANLAIAQTSTRNIRGKDFEIFTTGPVTMYYTKGDFAKGNYPLYSYVNMPAQTLSNVRLDAKTSTSCIGSSGCFTVSEALCDQVEKFAFKGTKPGEEKLSEQEKVRCESYMTVVAELAREPKLVKLNTAETEEIKNFAREANIAKGFFNDVQPGNQKVAPDLIGIFAISTRCATLKEQLLRESIKRSASMTGFVNPKSAQ